MTAAVLRIERGRQTGGHGRILAKISLTVGVSFATPGALKSIPREPIKTDHDG
jgi:hypothetical protein